ncbi:sugar ABC transporter permease [Mycoplasmopsis ciconiae]|uniref:Sugar ABC transporter permease n=1 Tax=Mycoplasmopsis ciconiae TaxID=561067 RepID=A0ABU7MKF1_9BACT|nr:sugar ABC transporter permease [Mycoplasmopsis ciconiae]
MKLVNNRLYEKIGQNVPLLRKWAYKKQTKRTQSLSISILDKRTPFVIPFLLLLPSIVIISIFTIVPMIYNLQKAFTVDEDYTIFRNFALTLADPRFSIGFRNSFIYGIFALPVVMSLSLVISSLIAKLSRKASKGFWQSVFFMPYVTNGVAVSLTFIQVFSTNGLFNQIIDSKINWLKSGDQSSFAALVPIMINGVWNGLAFNVLIFTTAMMGVDKNLYRSASIDGSSGFKQFFYITLPSIKGTFNFLITISIIGGIKVFPLALYENKPIDAFSNGASTLMMYVYFTATVSDQELSGAASILLFLIGFTFQAILRGGMFMAQLTMNYLGESNVWNKVNSKKLLH